MTVTSPFRNVPPLTYSKPAEITAYPCGDESKLIATPGMTFTLELFVERSTAMDIPLGVHGRMVQSGVFIVVPGIYKIRTNNRSGPEHLVRIRGYRNLRGNARDDRTGDHRDHEQSRKRVRIARLPYSHVCS